jgi:TonB family protein
MLKIIFISLYISLFIVGCSTSHLVSLDDNINAPVLVYKPLFIYPRTAQENNLTGKVHLILKIDKGGKVDSVLLDKSSGYDILDKSAMAFVKQFKYKPAESNGRPVQFYMKQIVNYYLVERNGLSQNYIKQVKELKKKIEKASPEYQLELQKELLGVYEDFINSNTDYIAFNQNIKKIVDNDSYDRWDETKNDWPLHFILFDDFQKNYPNSTINEKAKNLMFEYLKKDFDTANTISDMENDLLQKREKFDKTINTFLNEKYADVLPDSLNYLIQ